MSRKEIRERNKWRAAVKAAQEAYRQKVDPLTLHEYGISDEHMELALKAALAVLDRGGA